MFSIAYRKAAKSASSLASESSSDREFVYTKEGGGLARKDVI
jgi:hypothetical protein